MLSPTYVRTCFLGDEDWGGCGEGGCQDAISRKSPEKKRERAAHFCRVSTFWALGFLGQKMGFIFLRAKIFTYVRTYTSKTRFP